MAALAALIASACISASVSYAHPPDPRAPSIPWIHAGPVAGYLFYYGAAGPWQTQTDRVLITPGGGTSRYATKILWHVRGGSRSITVSGRRLDGFGRFQQRVRANGGYYPSIVDVPSAGCWRVTVRSGPNSGRFAFLALSP